MTDSIRLEKVTLSYGGARIIEEASFSARHGETKIILGPSGVGKSTILKSILGLLRPQAGKVVVHDREISALPEKEILKLRMHMAMVFQNGALFDTMTVGENVSYRLREFNLMPKNDIEERILEVLRFVGMEGARKLKPSQLSGGMRKRVAIARALAPDPDIILFDEPTVGLDPVNHHNTEQLIMKLKNGKKRTVIIVTHDVESACKMADSIVMLHQGRFIFEGTPDQLKKSTDHRILSFLNPAQHSN